MWDWLYKYTIKLIRIIYIYRERERYIYYIYCTCIKTFACVRMWHFYCRCSIHLVCHTATETFKENRIYYNNMYTCDEQICFQNLRSNYNPHWKTGGACHSPSWNDSLRMDCEKLNSITNVTSVTAHKDQASIHILLLILVNLT